VTPWKGEAPLTISAENEIVEALQEPFAGVKPGFYVVIKVTDTGSGIPREILDKIFEPFFTTKEMGKGTGLGLATVLGIVKSHAGFVQVQTEVNKGTTFLVYLPALEKGQPLKPKPSTGKCSAAAESWCWPSTTRLRCSPC
jgi:signal transduction histidine kinase